MAMLRAYNGTIETIISSKSDKSWYFLNCFVYARNAQVTFATKKNYKLKWLKNKHTTNMNVKFIHLCIESPDVAQPYSLLATGWVYP